MGQQHRTIKPNNCYQTPLFGDTYLTPQEALVYINQMLSTLKRYQEKTDAKRA